jgi:hypothetical protein
MRHDEGNTLKKIIVQNSGRYHELRWSVEIPDEREEYRADLSEKINEFKGR